MSNYFENLLNGFMDIDDEFISEAYTPQDIPYMQTVRRIVNFPKGNPIGKGELCYLYTDSVNKSIDIITGNDNFLHCNNYYYFYNLHYRGMLYNKRYNERHNDERKEIYDLIEKKTDCRTYNRMVIPPNETRNMFFDLSYYLELFNSFCKKMQFVKKIETFWAYLSSIIMVDNLDGYNDRFVLVDASQWTLGNNINENIKNPLFLMYYTLFRLPQCLKPFDIDFIFFNGNRILKVHPSDICDKEKKAYVDFKVEMKRIYAGNMPDIIDKATDDKNVLGEETETLVTGAITKAITSSEETPSSNIESNLMSNSSIEKRIAKHVNLARREVNVDRPDKVAKVAKLAEAKIDDDKELLKEIHKENQKKKTPTSSASSARDEELRQKQLDLVVNGLTIKELKTKNSKNIEIPTSDISASLTSTNSNMGKLKFNNFDQTYTEKLMPTDIINSIMSLNDKSIPMFIRDIKVEDSSDELNYKDTYTIYFEDANRQRHTVKIDIPKFIDNKFMYIGGNKKIIKKQSFLMPVVKTGPDTVQIVTNYNKMFIRRVDSKSLGSIERLEKLLRTNDEFRGMFDLGNAYNVNTNYVTTVEYDELSKIAMTFRSDKALLIFSQYDAEIHMNSLGIKKKAGYMYIGIDKKEKPIFINTETQKTDDGKYIIDLIIDMVDDSIVSEYSKIRPPKRNMYTKVKVMKKDVSVMLLICFWEGLTKVLKKMKVKYTLQDSLPSTLGTNQSFVKFADCILIYESDVRTSLLMNGLNLIDTSLYNITDMDTEYPYSEYFKKVYGKLSIMNALLNFYEFTIDPITYEVLQDINLPTDLVELMIHAVTLLADSQFVTEINQSLSRIRSNEIIPAILYDALAKNYINYRNSNGRKKYSIQQDIVIKNVLALKTVEDYSTLNPTLEVEASHAVSVKGFRGVNLDDSFTPSKRSYDPTMIGIIAPGTAPDGSTGIAKSLTLEPSITSLRGYVDIKKDRTDELKDVNLFSPGELTIPLGATLDDPTRLGHAIKQSKHVIPVKKSSPVLISNGMEEIMRFKLSTDFCVNAEESGEVILVDEENKIMVVKYKSGKHRAIKLSGTIVKNAGGGFFLSNVLVTSLKVGDKFKKNDVIAYHKDFFTNSKYNNCRMNMGTLTKVAIMSTYNTYEDGTMITHKLSEDASTEMCFEKKVVIGKNSNVEHIVNVGDHISVGESLVTFDTSYADSDLNALLANLGDDDKDLIKSSSRNAVPSKYSGVIEDIKVYSTVDLDELSPSLRKIVNGYYNKIKKRNAVLEQYDPESANSIIKCGVFCNETTKKVSPNKFGTVKGERADDSVVIEFYIKHSEPLEIGSKIANFTALKNTIDEIIPEGYEPWSELHPEEEVGTIIASNSILKRMTPSILYTALGYKCIIELKRELFKLWKKGGSEKRQNMTNMINRFFTAFDKTGSNTKKYLSLFEPMTDTQFNNYFKGFFEDENAYLVLDIVDYERNITLEDIERAAKSINIPLFEHVYMPHLNMDKDNVIGTTEPVPVGYVPIKRTQQTVMKKNGLSTNIDKRSAITAQVTGADKNGRESDLENAMLVSIGMDAVLRELNGPRADDLIMKQQMLRQIALNGTVALDELESNIENKTTLNTVNVFLLGMGIHSDLVTKGLMLPSTLKREL